MSVVLDISGTIHHMIVILVQICIMMISPANFFIFQNFVFWVFLGFQYVLLYISGIVDHIIKILIMVARGVFLYYYFFKWQSFKC